MSFETSLWSHQIQDLSGLFIVATPIGHLEDITLRALATLKNVDCILCEDTRETQKLLSHYKIKKNLHSFHEYNQKQKLTQVLDLLFENKKIALVTDRGTPLISDPGHPLVEACFQKGIPVHFIPGASSVLAGYVLSGFASTGFTFEGFLPLKKSEKIKRLQSIKDIEHTLIFFEAPHRIIKSLECIHEILGNRHACLLKELTKKFEKRVQKNLKDLIDELKDTVPKGEYVIILEGNKKVFSYEDIQDNTILWKNFLKKHEGQPLKREHLKDIAVAMNISLNTIYQKYLSDRA